MNNISVLKMDPLSGFLPSKNPSRFLMSNSDLNQQLNHIINNLPELIQTHYLREEMNSLNQVFESQSISINRYDQQQLDSGILILVMLAQAYIWETPDAPINRVPSVIARDLYQLCKFQQRFPTLTYADYVLHNWSKLDINQSFSLENIEPLFTFTGTKDEAWFIKIHVVIEALAGKALSAACSLVELTQTEASVNTLCFLLSDIAIALGDAASILDKMIDGCDPEVYWNSIRKYLNGWEQVKIVSAEGKMQSGVILEGVSIKDKVSTYQYKGASGAQSSIIPALDAALGVKHDIDGMYQTLLNFQQYMPASHQLIISFCKQSKIELILESSNSLELNSAWEHAVNQLKLFRQAHLKLVSHYIYRPAEKQGIASSNIVGTGGSEIEKYLVNRLHECNNLTNDSLLSSSAR